MENENNVVEEKSTEQKKKSPIGMIILVIVLMIGCLVGGYFLSDSGVLSKKSDDKTEKKSTTDNKKEKEEKDGGPSEEYLEKVSEVVFEQKKSSLYLKDIDKEKLISNLFKLINKSGDEVTGTELKELAVKYFGITDLEFVDLTCGLDGIVTSKYNPATDKYEHNYNHPGHGGFGDGVSHKLFNLKKTQEGDYYVFSMGIFYGNACNHAPCVPDGVEAVYLTYEDALKKENRVLSAVDAGYCSPYEEFYTCDWQKLYEDIKDKTKKVKFYYKKVNDNYIFDHYEVK